MVAVRRGHRARRGAGAKVVRQLAPNTGMSEEYTVQCAILGDKDGIFEVKIKSNEQVSALKNKIKQENPTTFALVEAKALKLSWVEHPAPDQSPAYSTLVEALRLRSIRFNQKVELSPLCVLSTLPDAFKVGNLHILVEVPSGASFNSMSGREVAEIVSPVLQPLETEKKSRLSDRSRIPIPILIWLRLDARSLYSGFDLFHSLY